MSTTRKMPGTKAGWALGAWLLMHQFLLAEPGRLAPVATIVLCAGILLRVFGVFPPGPAVWFLLGCAAVVAFVPGQLFAAAGGLGVLLGGVLLLRPLTPRRGLWVFFCAVWTLAAIALQESATVSTVFLIADVAALMFVLQLIHAPAESEATLLASALRSLRLILPVALIVTVVFWLFPAISSRTNAAFVGFAGGNLLSPGDVSEIRLTRRVAFVATFPETSAVPLFSDLYWRGQVLEKNEGLRWSADPARINSGRASAGAVPDAVTWKYIQQLGPMLAALDRPVFVKSLREGATVLETGASVFSVSGTGDVEVMSSSAPADDPPRQQIAQGSLQVPEKIRGDARVQDLAAKLFRPSTTLSGKLDALGNFLAAGGYSYTRRPGKMDAGDTPRFLFEHKKGFCGHYAAASACVLRVGGIPARVVTGFRGGTWNPWLRTIAVRDSDAHAWVEAWDENARRWTRFDPTSFIAPELSAMLELERDPGRWPWARLAATYALAQVERAAGRLDSAISNHFLPAMWAAAVAIAAAAIWRIFSRPKIKPDFAPFCLAKLEKYAASKNRPRRRGETPLAWLARLGTESPDGTEVSELQKFAFLYERLAYSADGLSAENSAALKTAANRLAKLWRKRRSDLAA